MRILIVGDAHGDKTYIHWMYDRAKKLDCQAIIQSGDLCWGWLDKTQYKMPKWLDQGWEKFGVEWYFIDGNHDNHDDLKHDAQAFVQVSDHAWYIPRGHSWTWGNTKFVGLGGAYSVDQYRRTPHHNWWPDEQPNLQQFLRAASHGECDILITHEAPGFHVRSTHHSADLSTFPAVVAQRADLQQLVEIIRPKHCYHGHWHVKYDDEYLNDGYTQIHGLGANVAYFPHRPNWHSAYEVVEV